MKKRAVIITGPGFQDEEVVYPYSKETVQMFLNDANEVKRLSS